MSWKICIDAWGEWHVHEQNVTGCGIEVEDDPAIAVAINAPYVSRAVIKCAACHVTWRRFQGLPALKASHAVRDLGGVTHHLEHVLTAAAGPEGVSIKERLLLRCGRYGGINGSQDGLVDCLACLGAGGGATS